MKFIQRYMKFNFFILFLSIILSTSTTLFLYQQITASKRRLSVLFLLTVLFYIIITVCNENGYWKKWKALDRITQFIFIIAIPITGLFIINAAHINIPESIFLIPRTKIIIHGFETNNTSQEKHIEINGIRNGDKWISYESIKLEGNGEILEDSIILYDSTAKLTLNAKIEDRLWVNFIAGPQSGMVDISIREEVVRMDLYADTIQEKPYSINKPAPQFLIFIPLIFFSSILGFLISFLIIISNWKASLIFKNCLVPVLLLILYSASFLYFSSRYLPEGVNHNFFSLLIKYLSVFVIVLYISIFITHKFHKQDQWVFVNSDNNFSPGDVLLLLLPLTPIVQYLIINKDILLLNDTIIILVFFIICSAVYLYLIPMLFSIFSSTKLLMLTGLAFVYTITNMAIFSNTFSWYYSGNFIIQLLFLVGTFTLAFLLYSMKDRRIFYYFILISFITNAAFQFLSTARERDRSSFSLTEENQFYSLTEEKEPVVTPNIYLLIYDAYVSNETMSGYGIDNTSQEDYLVEKGFELYPHTYSIAQTTINTMSSIMNVSTSNTNQWEAVSGDGVVHQILKNHGYSTYGLFRSDYFFRNVDSSYDHSIPARVDDSQIKVLISAILMGEFRFDLGIGDFKYQSHEEFVKTKQSIFKNISESPVFIYSHTPTPNHSQNSGKCLPDETELFKQRLDGANIEMFQDIEIITQRDPDAIVIIAGDHGPYLTKNCYHTNGYYDISDISRLDIQDRFGTFLAIRWPSEEYEKYDDIVVLQDIFPSILSYLYQDENILESKIDSLTVFPNTISGASVDEGIIHGGVNDGEALFISGK